VGLSLTKSHFESALLRGVFSWNKAGSNPLKSGEEEGRDCQVIEHTRTPEIEDQWSKAAKRE